MTTNIIILTGAGVSAESGISTFRDANGLWENHRIEEVASPGAFRIFPEIVHRFYNMRRAQLKSVSPNAAHHALAELERAWQHKGKFLLITQNVDDLHERAGSERLRHMHGEIRKMRCVSCKNVAYHEEDAGVELACIKCSEVGKMRPDIVWFGERPYHMAEIEDALRTADVFAAIGTSGTVYPAAGFVERVKQNNRKCRTVEINPYPTDNSDFDTVIAATATEGVPQWVGSLI
jgi:NAD-dependent deacetylase